MDTLKPATSGFVLAAAITVLFNTALAWAKDSYAPLTEFMKSLTGHQWTTHGLADLILFVVLGFVFSSTRTGQSMTPERLIGILTGAVTVAAAGLGLWYVFF